METFTFTPSGMSAPDADPAQALSYLYGRFEIDYGPSFRDADDRRHELAVVAVDLARRLIDLGGRMLHAADNEIVELTQLGRTRPEDLPDGEQATALFPLTVPLRARVAELDRTLRLLAVAYKQAWFNGSTPAVAAAEV